jgi:hypothetical protein
MSVYRTLVYIANDEVGSLTDPEFNSVLVIHYMRFYSAKAHFLRSN